MSRAISSSARSLRAGERERAASAVAVARGGRARRRRRCPARRRTPRRRSASASWRKKSSSKTSRRKAGWRARRRARTSVPARREVRLAQRVGAPEQLAARADARPAGRPRRAARTSSHEPLHELAQRRVLVVGRARRRRDDPPEVGRVAGLELLHLGLAHLAPAAEALGHLPRDEQRLARRELLQPPGRRVEEDELEPRRSHRRRSTLRSGLPFRIRCDADAARRSPRTIASSPARSSAMRPDAGAVLVRPGPELERLLHRQATALLERARAARGGPGELGERVRRSAARRSGVALGAAAVGVAGPAGRPSRRARGRAVGARGAGIRGSRLGVAPARGRGRGSLDGSVGVAEPSPPPPPSPAPPATPELLRDRDERGQMPPRRAARRAASPPGGQRLEAVRLGGEPLAARASRARRRRGRARPRPARAPPKPFRRGRAAKPSRVAKRSGGTSAARCCGRGVRTPRRRRAGCRPPARLATREGSPGLTATSPAELLLHELHRRGSRTPLAAGRCARSPSSPSVLPMSARAMGEVTLILPALEVRLELADDLVTSPRRPSRRPARVTVAPKTTRSPFSFETSITSARAIQSSTCRMRPSRCDCFSLAAWYSAFSERSPCERASAISFTILGRSTVLSRFSSSFSLSRPRLRHGHARFGHVVPSEKRAAAAPGSRRPLWNRASGRGRCQRRSRPARDRLSARPRGTPGASGPRGARPAPPPSRPPPPARRSGW